MKTEEGWHMYTEINQLIKMGLKVSNSQKNEDQPTNLGQIPCYVSG